MIPGSREATWTLTITLWVASANMKLLWTPKRNSCTIGFVQWESNPCLFISKKIICLFYVDDKLFYSPNKTEINWAQYFMEFIWGRIWSSSPCQATLKDANIKSHAENFHRFRLCLSFAKTTFEYLWELLMGWWSSGCFRGSVEIFIDRWLRQSWSTQSSFDNVKCQ